MTHTHAGVDSLRRRLSQKYKIHHNKYCVETIHSFALRFAGSYPKTTGLEIKTPQDDTDYAQIISSATKLFQTRLGKDLLRYSFVGIFVDEYQDCDISQHSLISNLAQILPCRIVGDPLQGIYDFGDNKIVNWDNDVFPNFDQLPDLTTPYRWKDTNEKLGERIGELRKQLLTREEIKFRSVIQDSYQEIIKCLYDSKNEDSVFVICEPSPSARYFPHGLAKSMNNTYHTIEPLTSQDLSNYAKKIEEAKGKKRLQHVVDFSKICLAKIANPCRKVIAQNSNLSEGEIALKQHFQNITDNNHLMHVYDLLLFFEEEFSPTFKRRQLWQEMKKGLYELVFGQEDTLEHAAWDIRNQYRFYRNRIPKRCISRTVLLKGLQCDHVIVVRPELFDKKNLYVALTRASSKVTIISNSRTWSNY